MCGIAGYFSLRGLAEEAVVRSMCARIVHRGPDDEGVLADGPCGIGMRRLSIIDLSGGHQPISNEDNSLSVVFNGEIYNYRALREELESQGHRFRTRSDTECIVHLYEQHGVEGLARLRGMFAIALWDAPQRRLLLARDRFGKKPLYYTVTPQGLYFASELKCLRGLGLPLEVDDDAIRLYLRLGYIPDPASPFRSVRKLLPGGWLLFGADGVAREGRYWRLPSPALAAPAGLSEEAAAERVRTVFDESVKSRMEADVPLGAFLSGGIDSGSVVASMALQSSQPVKTFSIGFEEKSHNELDGARMVARQYATDHHELIVRPGSVEWMEKIAAQFDEPFGDSSAIPTFLVSELARKHVTVVLTGDGGDELFLGYDSHFRAEALARRGVLPGWVRAPLSGLAKVLPYSAPGKNWMHAMSRNTVMEQYMELCYPGRYFRRRLHKDPWFSDGDMNIGWAMPPEIEDPLSKAIYFEASAKLTGNMLVKVDRVSMMNSIEVRCPLMDHVLAELAFSLPAAWHMRGGRGKALLLRAVGDRLPPGLLTLPKRGFGMPLAEWFRGPLRDFLRDHLTGPAARQRGFTDPAFVEYLLDEHQRGRRNNADRLWELLMLELWFRDWQAGAQA